MILIKTLLSGLEDITEKIFQKIEQQQKKDGHRKKKSQRHNIQLIPVPERKNRKRLGRNYQRNNTRQCCRNTICGFPDTMNPMKAKYNGLKNIISLDIIVECQNFGNKWNVLKECGLLGKEGREYHL